MARVTNSVARHRKRRRLLKRAKGFMGDRKNHVRLTSDAVMSALKHATVHRKERKRNFRRLWIIRIGVAARTHGLSYSRFIDGLARVGSRLNRKVLSEMAIQDPESFGRLALNAKAALAS